MPWTLVTGATSPLGQAIAYALTESGHDLILHYCLKEEEAKRLEAALSERGVEVKLLAGDFSSRQGVSHFLERLKEFKIDLTYLINNASVYGPSSFAKTDATQIEKMFQVNFFAPLALIQAHIDMIEVNKGAIINIGSAGAGRLVANSYNAIYTASKLAFLQATRSLAKELAPFGVAVNMVSPGHLEHSIDLADYRKEIPMGRPGAVVDVVNAILFLLDPLNRYITGQNIEVAGGALL